MSTKKQPIYATEFAARTLRDALALAARQGFCGKPDTINFCGALCVLRFTQPDLATEAA